VVSYCYKSSIRMSLLLYILSCIYLKTLKIDLRTCPSLLLLVLSMLIQLYLCIRSLRHQRYCSRYLFTFLGNTLKLSFRIRLVILSMCFPCRCGRKFVLFLRKKILFGDFIILFVYEIEVQKR
jgi:hypothetical protein